MDDYNLIMENIQVELGRHFLQSPEILNQPGRSLACKIDPLYYLAMPKSLLDTLGLWTGLLPEKVCAALIRTGNMISSEQDRSYIIPLKLSYAGAVSPVNTPVPCCFLEAEFIDRTLAIYAALKQPLPVSGLRIQSSERPRMDEFLLGKSQLLGLAYA